MLESLIPVVAEADQNRTTFAAFCRSLTGDELARPVPEAAWAVKDYIAHLATIDTWVGDWFAHLADGRPFRPAGDNGAPFSIDAWNEREVVARRALSVDELLDEAAAGRGALWTTVERFTPPVLEQMMDFHGNRISFLRYLQLWAGHDPAHARDMSRALPERAGDEALMSWFAAYAASA